MHTIKGGWIGQTFALAQCNDSGGKKSRIRRSKEERKAMVESFIKKYQKSYNGNFPSLNLTHKEVGGSFYTVREIVREIIQENRVLGSAKLTPEESFLEQYPLGTISMEPRSFFSSSNESQKIIDVVNNSHHGTSEERAVNSTEQFPGYEHQLFGFDNGEIVHQRVEVVEEDKEVDKLVVTDAVCHNTDTDEDSVAFYSGPGAEHLRFDSGLIINRSGQPVEKVKRSGGQMCEEPKYVESQAVEEINKSYGISCEEPLAEQHEVKELETLKLKKAGILTDLVVETFPLRPVSKTIYDLDENSNGPGTENIKLEAENSYYVVDGMDSVEKSSGLIYERPETDVPAMLSEENNGLVDDKAVVNDGKPLLETSICSKAEESIILNNTDHEAKDLIPAGIESVSEEATAIKCKPDGIQLSGNAEKGSNQTLSRINLESWEGSTEKSSRSESNTLLALFKAFVAALVKFWTE